MQKAHSHQPALSFSPSPLLRSNLPDLQGNKYGSVSLPYQHTHALLEILGPGPKENLFLSVV